LLITSNYWANCDHTCIVQSAVTKTVTNQPIPSGSCVYSVLTCIGHNFNSSYTQSSFENLMFSE